MYGCTPDETKFHLYIGTNQPNDLLRKCGRLGSWEPSLKAMEASPASGIVHRATYSVLCRNVSYRVAPYRTVPHCVANQIDTYNRYI